MAKRIILILIIGVLLSFQEYDSLIGKWKIYNVEINNNPIVNKQSKWIKFIKNGKLEGGDFKNKNHTKKGTWKIDYKNKTVMFKSENSSKDDGIYFYEFSNSNNKLTLIKDSVKVYLIKIDLETN